MGLAGLYPKPKGLGFSPNTRKLHALSIADNISGVNVSFTIGQGHSIVRFGSWFCFT